MSVTKECKFATLKKCAAYQINLYARNFMYCKTTWSCWHKALLSRCGPDPIEKILSGPKALVEPLFCQTEGLGVCSTPGVIQGLSQAMEDGVHGVEKSAEGIVI